MAHKFGDYLLDYGLAVLDTDAVSIFLNSQDPTTYTEASSTYMLAGRTWAAGGAWGSPQAGDTNGRKVMSTSFTDGEVFTDGLATDWSTVDGSHLLVNGGLNSSQQVYDGNSFSLPSFKVEIPNQ